MDNILKAYKKFTSKITEEGEASVNSFWFFFLCSEVIGKVRKSFETHCFRERARERERGRGREGGKKREGGGRERGGERGR